MKKSILLPSIILFTILLSCVILVAQGYRQSSTKTFTHQKGPLNFKDADIIFQCSVSPQCEAIKLATKSEYTHCGLLFNLNDEWKVIEAVQPVRITPFDEFIKRGKNGHYVVKRLKNREVSLNEKVLKQMQDLCASYIGKNYDSTFEWDDSEIYCSELVWKVYHQVSNIEVGKLQKLREFDLSSPLVKQTLQERYGKNIPLDETVISPAAIFASDKLLTVHSEK